MSESKDIAAHLDHCADVRGAQGGPGAGSVMNAESATYGMATLTVGDLRRAAAEIRALRSALATALALAELHCGNLDPAATAEIERARALLSNRGEE